MYVIYFEVFIYLLFVVMYWEFIIDLIYIKEFILKYVVIILVLGEGR